MCESGRVVTIRAVPSNSSKASTGLQIVVEKFFSTQVLAKNG